MIWPILLIVWFLAWETFALFTKERYCLSLSRWTWRKTAWQVTIYRPGPPDPRPFEIGKPIFWFTFRPLRILLFIGMSWATLHLSFGECAFGVC